MKKIMKNEKGFTLIELIIVIAILAIIAAVAIPNILNAVDNSRKATDVSNAKIIANAAAQLMAKNEDLADTEYLADAALDVSSISASGITFPGKLFDELSGNPPVPKFKGTTVEEDSFYLVIDANRNISVYVGDNADVSTSGNALIINPTPDTAYDQK